jgi:hypothetical protein
MRERDGMAMNYHVIVIVPATMGSAGRAFCRSALKARVLAGREILGGAAVTDEFTLGSRRRASGMSGV